MGDVPLRRAAGWRGAAEVAGAIDGAGAAICGRAMGARGSRDPGRDAEPFVP
ncbi:hypothetical protein DFJ69_4592 [Thermomonospora umbrina]|uniref:Uncharacterized protein n=1 Tax=Thermomonospora umbrina TaxID=111806 RepID=A0A3D9SU07_9ACTN|nr:hypothetical protein DFJ69_4592 [Thermomonospora umbrina]